ncbi:MAG: hypothetical protein RLZZ116_761 [Planctomycetota bacterium]|jgi:hypothetical protein
MSGGRAPALHVVNFEESADCTLERIARESQDGDAVLVLGPQAFVARLRALGLPSGVEVQVVGRSAGRFRNLPIVGVGSGAIAHGVRARAAVDDALVLCGIPDALPPSQPWASERRARVRRELGLAAHEFALAMVGEPSEWVDPSFAIRAASMARVAGAPIRLLASPRTPRIAKLGAFFEQAAQGKPVIVDERIDRPWEVFPAVDAIVADQDGAATMPPECAGWRNLRDGERTIPAQPMSPLPALWALACGIPAFVHASIDLGAHGEHALVHRFADDVAQLAREIQAFASSASAASR